MKVKEGREKQGRGREYLFVAKGIFTGFLPKQEGTQGIFLKRSHGGENNPANIIRLLGGDSYDFGKIQHQK